MGGGDAASADIGKKIVELAPWFHNLHLPDGSQTAPDHPLGDFPAFKWRQIADAIPDDLTGWSVLDIGCNAGFYSFQLARRGGSVLAIDHDEHYLSQARWAASVLGLEERVRFAGMGVYDLARLDRTFDLVLFMGVLYHLRHPLLALDIVAEKVVRTLVFQTLTMPGDEVVTAPDDVAFEDRQELLRPGWPKMAFVEKSLAGDPTNWWVANRACVEAMLRSAGLEVEAAPAHEVYVCRRASTDGSPHKQELEAATGRAANEACDDRR
ncbi:MAG: TIGR04290 family methyltransferase [Actinomycetota bacterium]|nr:TIGR04290 family methyltransferase [Actinomycetota bacterium]